MNKQTRAWGLGLSAMITIIVWQLPLGAYILYPLTILATWFHEMGHGLCALMLGGSFHRLDLFSTGAGLAAYSGDLFLGQFGRALVAAAGPIGPALAGSLLILASINQRMARRALYILALVMIISLILWIRTGFGVLMITAMSGGLFWAASKGSASLHIWTVQFLGVNASISVFLQLDYLFTHRVLMNGREFTSDTGQIANVLLMPYWFWAILLAILTLLLPFISLRRAFR